MHAITLPSFENFPNGSLSPHKGSSNFCFPFTSTPVLCFGLSSPCTLFHSIFFYYH
jgi:hypothetical protein